MPIVLYDKTYKARWDEFVRTSKNGTFLLMRDYMDYHSDRFEDHSLIYLDSSNTILALLPANRQQNKLFSHQGLTYGGLIVNAKMTQSQMLNIFQEMQVCLFASGITQFIYKTIPNIYHRRPCDEDHYALFLQDATLIRRDVLTVIDRNHPIDFQTRRKRQIKKAERLGLQVIHTHDFAAFWDILQQNLQAKHGVTPVHSLAEITSLVEKFPENIKLYGCFNGEQMLAGVVIYETETVAHFQYIAASDDGKSIGALDWLFANLIQQVYANKRYIDFGISNEQNGRYLNTGLIDYKEGFGGSSIKHDHYQIEIRAS